MKKLSDSLTKKDLNFISSKNISKQDIDTQYNNFINGFESLNIFDCATISNGGIKSFSQKTLEFYKQLYENYQYKKNILKFVPASGAASRMFKDLYKYLEDEFLSEQMNYFFSNLRNLAFFEDLNKFLSENNLSIEKELSNKNYKTIVSYIIHEKGLNYGNLPKAMIKFHKYPQEVRTSFEEHIVESLLYAKSNSGNNIHFTVSPEHLPIFERVAAEMKSKYQSKYDAELNIDFSIQEPNTDTIALTPENEPFRLQDGTILFRPGGHGALIYNLNNLQNDIIFIKNIDNVVPDDLKTHNCIYKKALAGILIETQQKIFEHIDLLLHYPSVETIEHAFNFLHNTLSVKTLFNFSTLSKTQKLNFLISKLDRPLRVCGMVKNEGEPGGGPFFVRHKDNTASLQIVEKSQLDLKNPDIKAIFDKSTHFNPVDIVFSPIRYNGQKFDLTKFIDQSTGFISEKTKDGRPLKALELPGLWNGAMADWNSIFVEVPSKTFNPAKTIFDLLRENRLSSI